LSAGGEKVYIAGPMTGYPAFNFPAFHEAQKWLEGHGYEVFNPALADGGDTSKSWDYYLRRDIPALCECDLLVALPGWARSRGAVVEVAVARMLGIPCLAFETMSPLGAAEPEPILHEASRLVHGDRNRDYTHPWDDFTRVGRIWGALLNQDPISPRLVGCMLAGLKLSRESQVPKRDNRVDLAGYAECLEMVDERERQAQSVTSTDNRED